MFRSTIIEAALRHRANQANQSIPKEKMALLLYWAYGWTLANRGNRLISGGFVASDIGPVPKQWRAACTINLQETAHSHIESISWIVESTWVSLAGIRYPVLLDITTGRGSAWRAVLEDNQGDVSHFPEIADGLILSEFKWRMDRTFPERKQQVADMLTRSNSLSVTD